MNQAYIVAAYEAKMRRVRMVRERLLAEEMWKQGDPFWREVIERPMRPDERKSFLRMAKVSLDGARRAREIGMTQGKWPLIPG